MLVLVIETHYLEGNAPSFAVYQNKHGDDRASPSSGGIDHEHEKKATAFPRLH
jgi:hypothetical protein